MFNGKTLRQEGMLIVVSGPSGVGKDTMVGEFLKTSPDCVLSVSATTRPIRPGEEHGRDYHYLEHHDFLRKAEIGDMLEWAEYNGKHYGTPRSKVELERKAGRHVILVIEVQGAASIRKICPEAVLVFIMPPSVEALRERLLNRAADDACSIERRLRIALDEMSRAQMYDYILTNEDFRVCAEDFGTVIKAASLSPKHTGLHIEL